MGEYRRAHNALTDHGRRRTEMALPIEPLGKVRTKIVATVGPASRDRDTLRSLVKAGVDVFRLNFSHGTHAEHADVYKSIRAVKEDDGLVAGILMDLGGPKIRLGPIPGDAVECSLGETFALVADRTTDDPRQLTCSYRRLCADLRPGDLILFADGTVAMQVQEVSASRARLLVTLPGCLRSRQGLNLPGCDLAVSALTEKDLLDLDWALEHPIEYVGLSFVRRAQDVVRLRTELDARRVDARIVAKIEKPQAVENLESILAATDAVMVARGDLGVEMDVAQVPAIQKRIIAACHGARVPVITATQMLTSMEISNRPTRAEASDVFNAVLDGTDAVMLSGETAVGAYPIEAVATMSRIVAEAEKLLPAIRADRSPHPVRTRQALVTPITDGVVEAASHVCTCLGASLLVVATHSGRTALAVSKHRHATPTLAVACDIETARRMTLYWGVTPLHFPQITDIEELLTCALDWAREHRLVAKGDRVVLLRGTVPGEPVHNALLVQEVT
jgi:pyruvate kinase